MSPSRDQALPVVGVDFGATKIRAGVCTPEFELQRMVKCSTKVARGELAVLERIARTVRDAVDEADLTMAQIRGVGIAAPGLIDLESGKIQSAASLHWREVPLRQWLEAELGLPVFVENDGYACTWAVHQEELKARPQNLLGIFVGANIASGRIVSGKPHRDSQGAAEISHLVVRESGPLCACGQRGCLEALASRNAIGQQIRAAIKEGQPCVLTEMVEDWSRLRSGDLRKALRRGDKVVAACLAEAATHIGTAAALLAAAMKPDLIVLGGGLLESVGEELLPAIQAAADRGASPHAGTKVEIRLSSLGDEAAILGSAMAALAGTA